MTALLCLVTALVFAAPGPGQDGGANPHVLLRTAAGDIVIDLRAPTGTAVVRLLDSGAVDGVPIASDDRGVLLQVPEALVPVLGEADVLPVGRGAVTVRAVGTTTLIEIQLVDAIGRNPAASVVGSVSSGLKAADELFAAMHDYGPQVGPQGLLVLHTEVLRTSVDLARARIVPPHPLPGLWLLRNRRRVIRYRYVVAALGAVGLGAGIAGLLGRSPLPTAIVALRVTVACVIVELCMLGALLSIGGD